MIYLRDLMQITARRKYSGRILTIKFLVTNTLVIFLLILSFGLKAQKSNHIEFLSKQNTSAKDYIIQLFDEHDVVIICERIHSEMTLYKLLHEVVKDSSFINRIGHIYTEIGVANMDNRINKFLSTNTSDSVFIHDNITSIIRNSQQYPAHEHTNYPWFLKKIHHINQDLSFNKKIHLHPCDIIFDWDSIRTVQDYKNWWDKNIVQKGRDKIMSQNFMDLYHKQLKNDNRNKALIVMNFRHAFLTDNLYSPNETTKPNNFGAYLKDSLGNKVASVYMMGLGHPNSFDTTELIKNGRWHAYFEYLNKENIGFDLKNSLFGEALFDVWPTHLNKDSLKYSDVFTGLVYYKPIDEHVLSFGWPGLVSGDFMPELIRRFYITNKAMNNSIERSKSELKEAARKVNKIHKFKYDNLDSIKMKINKQVERLKKLYEK
jgi:hypothetical protein